MNPVVETPLYLVIQKRDASVSGVAKELGIDKSHLSRIARGEVRASAEMALRLTEHFDNEVTRDQIIFPEFYVDLGKKIAAPPKKLEKAS